MLDQNLEESLRDLIVDLCEVLYNRGYHVVSIGAMMRLMGVDPESASQHDDDYFSLDNDFVELLKNKKSKVPAKAPSGVTLH